MTSDHPKGPDRPPKYRSVGVGTTGTERTEPQNRSFTLSEVGTNTDIVVLMFRSVETQTAGGETREIGPGQSRESSPEHIGTQVERPFLAPPGYPTSKLSEPLPSLTQVSSLEHVSTQVERLFLAPPGYAGQPLSPEHIGTQVERNFLAPPGYTSRPPTPPTAAEGTQTKSPKLFGEEDREKDLRWLKWATGTRSPPLVTFVNSIVSASKKRRAEFLRVNRTVNLPSDYSDSWFAPVTIGGRNFFFLCDTGSAATIITPAVYKRIPSQYKTPLIAPDFTLRNASADGVPVSGLCCLEMGLGPETFPCRVVVADINCDGIIGQNFLEHYKCILDMASGSIQLPRGKLFMAKGRKPTVSRVHTSEDVMIPASSQLVLRCRLKSHACMSCTVGVVEPTRKAVLRYGILVGRCLVNSRPQIPVLVLNPGKAPVFVPAGSFIALLKPVCYLDDQKVEEPFLPGLEPRLSNSTVETAVKSRLVRDEGGGANAHFKNPSGAPNRTTADLIDPGSNDRSPGGFSTPPPVHPSLGSMEVGEKSPTGERITPNVNGIMPPCTTIAPSQGDSPPGSCHGSGTQPQSQRRVRSDPRCVHPSLGSITGGEDRQAFTANWVETYGVHPSLDSICTVNAQGAGVPEKTGSVSLPLREPNGEPLIGVRLPTENRFFYLNPHSLPAQPAEELSSTAPQLVTANIWTEPPSPVTGSVSPVTLVTPGAGEDRYCAATHLLATKDTDEDSSTSGPSGEEEDEGSMYLSARSTVSGGVDVSGLTDVSPATGEPEDPPSVPVLNVTARYSHPREGKIYVPEHLINLIPQDLSTGEQYELAKTLIRYEDIFVGPDGTLGKTNVVKHEILTGDSRPIKHAPRRVGPHQQEIIQTEVDKMLSAGVIAPSESPWASPVVIVRKKDGSVRFCVDYRRLNAVTVKDAYPLPNIEDAVNTLSGAQYFCTLDLASGYWQVELSEEAKQKTAFVTREGLFQFNVMPFGLSNAPATFERLMELVLKGMTWRQCVVYIDDIIVFGKTFEETHTRLQAVFDRLRQARLRLKPKKCFLFKPSTLYLGYVVSSEGVKPDPNKVESLRTWHRPCDLKGLRAFLGMASYHRKFIRNFAEVAEPLINLTRRKTPWSWEDPQQQAFDILRTALMTEPVLAHPTREGEFILDTDASAHSLGGALYQVQGGEERLIGYASKTLSGAQKNYCTTKRELLAVVRMVKQFRHYLWGTRFTVRTDHASLTWLLRFKDADGMLARWIAELAPYQITVSYREGKNHLNADGLSRRRCRGCPRLDCPDKDSPSPDSLCSSSSDGELDPCDPQIKPRSTEMEKAKLSPLPDMVLAAVTPVTESGGISERPPGTHAYTNDEILELQQSDSDISPVLRWLSNGTDRPDESLVVMGSAETQSLVAQWDRLSVKNGVLIHHGGLIGFELPRYVAPKCIRLEILHLAHDNVLSGHCGINRTRERVRTRWYWPQSFNDIARYVGSCPTCRQRKGALPNRKSPLQKQLIGVPFQRIGMDVLDVHHISGRGNRYIIVIVDYFSKWSIAVARKNHKAITCAEVIVNQFVCQFGVPLEILSDQGREFEGRLFQGVCKLLRIHKIRTTPYRPQTDGLVERHNRTLLELLSKYVRYQYSDWDDHLPFLTMAYNTSVHDSTGCTPFSLVYGREALLPTDLVYPPVNFDQIPCSTGAEYVEFLRNSISETRNMARRHLERTALRQKRNYDVRAKNKPEFKPGDLVRYYYVREKAGNKFHRCFVGPYVIISRESDMNYKICGKLKDSGREDIRIVHADHLISFETDRSKLFPHYGPVNQNKGDILTQAQPPIAESIEKHDIFAHSSSGDEVELVFTGPPAHSDAPIPSPDSPPAVSGERDSDKHSTPQSTAPRTSGEEWLPDREESHESPVRRWPRRIRNKPDRLGHP